MWLTRNTVLGIAFLLSFGPSSAQGKGTCALQPLMHQRKDEATVQRLENAWSIAFLQGDVDLERCLLAPDFKEILRTGEVKVLADELEFAVKNKGKNLTIPALPKSDVLIHGNVAVAEAYRGQRAPTASRERCDTRIITCGKWHLA
jgi:hypothetical protein